MASPATLTLPELHYPYPFAVNPATDRAEQVMLDWLCGHGLMRQPEVLEAFRRTQFAGLIGHEYPMATPAGLELVSRFCGWIFVVDDYVCDTGVFGQDLGKLAAFHAWMREVLETPERGGLNALGDAVTSNLDAEGREFCRRIARAAADCFADIAAHSTPSQYMRFASEMSYYFQGTLWEAGHHAAATKPTPGEYMVGRRMTCGTPFGLSLQDIAAGYEVPANDYLHAEVRALRMMTSNINSWCDDIFSYGKEREALHAEPLNLPTSLVHHDNLDEQAALEETARLHNNEIDAYLTAEARVARWAGPQLTRFLGNMRTMQRGFYDWGLATPRYNVRHYFGDRAGDAD